jgi:REP-associated tyrosine transposase
MQGLTVRIAKALNAMMKRKGAVFADHYFSRLLATPTELVRAIRYVLANHAHHFGHQGVDPYSSFALTEQDRTALLGRPVSWLLRAGWRRIAPDLFGDPADTERMGPVGPQRALAA